MRLFVAVTPPPEVRQAALERARNVSWKGLIRWVPPRNVHLTLKFLGETPEETVPQLEAALEQVCTGHGAFDLALEGVGAFPSAGKARTLWVGAGQGSDSLTALAEDVEDALQGLGFEREKRPFHPHATVGRAKYGRAAMTGEEPASEPLRFRVRSVELVRSRLTDEGAIYSVAASFALGAST